MTSEAPALFVPHAAAGRGGTARRAVSRWAWRMFRREWRQQVLVLVLLAATVAASVGVAAAAYSTTSVADNAEFGAASHFIRVANSEPDALAATVVAAKDRFENVEVIHHREVSVPGLFEAVDYRSQDPSLPLGRPRLTLVDGVYPRGTRSRSRTGWRTPSRWGSGGR